MDIIAPRIVFENISVHLLENNAGIFIGKNRQFRWTTMSGGKSGFGTISGNNNEIAYNKNVVFCDDCVDSSEADT